MSSGAWQPSLQAEVICCQEGGCAFARGLSTSGLHLRRRGERVETCSWREVLGRMKLTVKVIAKVLPGKALALKMQIENTREAHARSGKYNKRN